MTPESKPVELPEGYESWLDVITSQYQSAGWLWNSELARVELTALRQSLADAEARVKELKAQVATNTGKIDAALCAAVEDGRRRISDLEEIARRYAYVDVDINNALSLSEAHAAGKAEGDAEGYRRGVEACLDAKAEDVGLGRDYWAGVGSLKTAQLALLPPQPGEKKE